jgi:hypothetical protein
MLRKGQALVLVQHLPSIVPPRKRRVKATARWDRALDSQPVNLEGAQVYRTSPALAFDFQPPFGYNTNCAGVTQW